MATQITARTQVADEISKWTVVASSPLLPRAADHRLDRFGSVAAPAPAAGVLIGLIAAPIRRPGGAPSGGAAVVLGPYSVAGPGRRRGGRATVGPPASRPRGRCRSGSGDRTRPPTSGRALAAAARCSPTTRRPPAFRLGLLAGEAAGQLLLAGSQRVHPEVSLGVATQVSVREPRSSRRTSSSAAPATARATALAVAPENPFGPIAVTTVTPVEVSAGAGNRSGRSRRRPCRTAGGRCVMDMA